MKRVIIAIEKPPYKSKDDELKQEFARLVQQQLAKFNMDKVDVELLAFLDEQNSIDLFEYINKSFEMVTEGKKVELHPNFLLKLHQKIIQTKGKFVILSTITKRTSLVKRYDNFKKQSIQQV